MIAIGSYGMPSIIQLQARLIRHHCGDLPIMVSDDHTEDCHRDDPDQGLLLKERLLEVCRTEGLIYRETAPERIGHSGGDLGAFYHGLVYAREHGLPYLCKLSQRFLLDIPDWFRTATAAMQSRGRALSSRQCRYGEQFHFHIRTECVFMSVARWSPLIEHLRPRQLGMAAEQHVYHLHRGFDEPILGCSLFGDNRLDSGPGIVWKDHADREETDAAYKALFAKFGVRTGDDFNTGHSHLLPNYRI
jgi:hypothetical protein